MNVAVSWVFALVFLVVVGLIVFALARDYFEEVKKYGWPFVFGSVVLGLLILWLYR